MEEYTNKEQKIYQEIENSMEEVTVPEEILPDQIVKDIKRTQKRKQRKKWLAGGEVAAAVLLLMVGAQVGGTYLSSTENVNEVREEKSEKSASVETAENTGETKKSRKKKIGNNFVLAESYEDVYDSMNFSKDGILNIFNRGNAIYEEIEVEATAAADVEDLTKQMDFSTTNLQTEGVDEADLVKTNGKYLYIADGEYLKIIELQNTTMRKVCEIRLSDNLTEHAIEMYIEENRVYIITERTQISTERKDYEYTINNGVEVALYTYEIFDSNSPDQIGCVTVEGQYRTSRKVGQYIYLFTDKNLRGIKKGDKEEIIPYVDGYKMPCDCIYYEDTPDSEMIIASVDINNPDDVFDNVMVMSSNSQIYVGNDGFYLYRHSYETEEVTTEITKFTYFDGYISGCASNSLPGTIQDTFAISEKDGILRVLTTRWSSNHRDNSLYILNEKMKPLGDIQKIAPDEMIYAARYIGDKAYFITFRNTDPLFIADLSDPFEPKIIGEVEITGFSDYLHMYDEDHLLGIGYEYDKDGFREEGGKLVMFDITDAENPVVEAAEVIPEIYEIISCQEYKQIIVDKDKELITFVDQEGVYYVYGYNDGKFMQRLAYDTNENYYCYYIRGVYVEDFFYIIDSCQITSFDMTHDFEKGSVIEY